MDEMCGARVWSIHLVVVEEMPRNAAGKVLKHELRRRIVQTRAAASGERDDVRQDGG